MESEYPLKEWMTAELNATPWMWTIEEGGAYLEAQWNEGGGVSILVKVSDDGFSIGIHVLLLVRLFEFPFPNDYEHIDMTEATIMDSDVSESQFRRTLRVDILEAKNMLMDMVDGVFDFVEEGS